MTKTEKTDANMDDPAFFVVSPPRTGSSLLTVLLNAHPRVAIAQDTSVFAEFKDAVISSQKIVSNTLDRLKHRNLHLTGDSFQLVRDNAIDLGDQRYQLILGLFMSNFLRFHAHDTFKDDPRKDRGTGLRYVGHVDFSRIFGRIADGGITLRQFLNMIIHDILDGEAIEGDVRGEKTPAHARLADLLAGVYPEAKFINLVRNPIAFVGSRRQRIEATIEDHCNHFLDSTSRMVDDPERTVFVRYEDVVADPNGTLRTLHKYLGVEPVDLPEVLDPGVYPKYVGDMVDPERDRKNLDATTEPERAEIKEHLGAFFARFYPEQA